MAELTATGPLLALLLVSGTLAATLVLFVLTCRRAARAQADEPRPPGRGNQADVLVRRPGLRSRGAATCSTLGVAVLSLATLGTRCPSAPRYEVTMSADASGIVRTIRRVRDERPDSFSNQEEARLREIYGPAKDDQSFQKHFTFQLPGDLGGQGWLRSSRSLLGVVRSYHERLAGEGRVGRFAELVDTGSEQLAELLAGWLAWELGDPRAAVELERALRQEMLPTLRDLAFLSWLAESGLLDSQELEERMYHLAVETGFLKPSDRPRDVDLAPIGKLIEHKLTTAGVATDAASRKLLRGILSPEETPEWQSWFLAYVQSRQDFQAWLSSQADEGSAALDSEQLESAAERWLHESNPAAAAVVGLCIGFAPELSGYLDSVDIRLALPAVPIRSNGRRDPEGTALEWTGQSLHGPLVLPRVLFAVWAEPNTEFQRTHLGGVVVAEDTLEAYDDWYQELRSERKREWDRFISSLTPGDTLVGAIRRFRFADEPAGDSAEQVVETEARPAIDLLLDGLGVEEDRGIPSES